MQMNDCWLKLGKAQLEGVMGGEGGQKQPKLVRNLQLVGHIGILKV